jgi:hydroxymethylpyrimidine/phosphomethylpyrimidine kinase
VLSHAYVRKSIATSYDIGSGHGPLNHIQSITYRPLPPYVHLFALVYVRHRANVRPTASPSAANPQPFTTHLISSIKPLWNKYINHPFVLQLGQGTLDKRRFAHYLQQARRSRLGRCSAGVEADKPLLLAFVLQDWLYLRHYARAHGLMSYKATTFDDITAFSSIALHVGRESNMHVTVSTGPQQQSHLQSSCRLNKTSPATFPSIASHSASRWPICTRRPRRRARRPTRSTSSMSGTAAACST